MKKPLLITTLGYPGSGKTYFSERLAKKEGFFHLAGDKLRLAMFENPTYTRSEHNAVYRFADYLTEQFLKRGVSVIYDANFNFRKSRKNAQRIAKKTHAEYRLVWIKTEEDEAIKRLKKRSKLKNLKRKELYRPISLKNFRDLQAEIEKPTTSESFTEIDGHISFPEQYKQFRSRRVV